MSATVGVTNAGRPIVAPHAASSMSTTGPGQRPRCLTPELFGRQLLKPDPAPEGVPDHAHLLRLARRLGAREDVVAARVPVLLEGPR
jgi:hypothetical protein